MAEIFGGLVGLIFGAIALAAVVWVCIVLPYKMAETRGRSGVLWVLFGFVVSPIASILLLVLLGPVAQAAQEK